MKRVLIIAGPSAVGKTTVAKEIIDRGIGFELSRSATTRLPREDGHDGEYIYLTEPEFRERIGMGDMLEFTEYNGNFYGTPVSEIERIFESGKIPLLVLDIKGVESLKMATGRFVSYSVYLTADMAVLDKRLLERAQRDGFSAKAMKTCEERKMQNRRDLLTVMERERLFDARIQNIKVEECADDIIKAFFTE